MSCRFNSRQASAFPANWFAESSKSTPFKEELLRLRPAMALAAQKAYDEWMPEDDFDDEYGSGGICDAISNALGEVASMAIGDIELLDGGQDGDDHAWLIARRDNEVYGIDIPCGLYESGSGYVWKKLPGVTFESNHVLIFSIPFVPEDWPPSV